MRTIDLTYLSMIVKLPLGLLYQISPLFVSQHMRPPFIGLLQPQHNSTHLATWPRHLQDLLPQMCAPQPRGWALLRSSNRSADC